MKALIILLIALGVLIILILYAAIAVPMSEIERKAEDEAQMEALRRMKQ